ncbi:hypothetical protein RAS1_06330 [Phycisphaerae bacterium RAS1]|nr:hypothetical protein RAS1_06330 [Phycisphaerae bacterium RAS1]
MYRIAMLTLLAAAAGGFADDKSATTQPAAKPPTAATAKRPLDKPTLERAFQESLNDVVLLGNFQAMTPDEKTGKIVLSPPRAERYSIASAARADDDRWRIDARIQYDDHDVTIPVLVRVLWAGDTPVITLDDVALPGLGTYSARVMIYRGYYSGTWFGPDCGGVLSGQIFKAADVPPPAGAKAKPDKD